MSNNLGVIVKGPLQSKIVKLWWLSPLIVKLYEIISPFYLLQPKPLHSSIIVPSFNVPSFYMVYEWVIIVLHQVINFPSYF